MPAFDPGTTQATCGRLCYWAIHALRIYIYLEWAHESTDKRPTNTPDYIVGMLRHYLDPYTLSVTFPSKIYPSKCSIRAWLTTTMGRYAQYWWVSDKMLQELPNVRWATNKAKIIAHLALGRCGLLKTVVKLYYLVVTSIYHKEVK